MVPDKVILYLLYVNDLMDRLETSESGLKIFNYIYDCPTSADDMVLISLTKNRLQK